MDSLLQGIPYGFRSLARNRLFAVAFVLTLAVGIGANTAVFTLVDSALIRLMPVRGPDRLLLLGSRTSMSMIQADGPGSAATASCPTRYTGICPRRRDDITTQLVLPIRQTILRIRRNDG